MAQLKFKYISMHMDIILDITHLVPIL